MTASSAVKNPIDKIYLKLITHVPVYLDIMIRVYTEFAKNAITLVLLVVNKDRMDA